MKFFDDEDDTGEKMLINTLQPAMLAAVVFCMMLFVQPGWLPGIESWLHLCIGGFLTGMVFSFIAFFTVARRVKTGGMQASLAGGLVHRFVKCHWDYVRWAITGIILAIAMMAAVLKSKIIGDVLLDTVMVALTTGALASAKRLRRRPCPRARLFRLPAHVLRREEEQGKGVGPPETGASPALCPRGLNESGLSAPPRREKQGPLQT